ncbi:MAG: SUMF1/EgtB/PvdO family nonheme iron enzyme [Balneolaceae bacterium]
MKGTLFLLILVFAISSSEISADAERQDSEFDSYSEQISGSEEQIELEPVPGGVFQMGDPDVKQRDVRVDDFWMAKYEVTWQQYELFSRQAMDELADDVPNPDGAVQIGVDAISIPTPPYVEMSFGMGTDGYPAISMTHYAALNFAKWLTAKTGNFYRLPTEAEWEYACRAGSETVTHTGDSSDLDQYEWHEENSSGTYNRVGTREPNAFGLHDMMGNVAEWTMDKYYEDYLDRLEGDIADNPWFRPDVLYPRAVRGGSYRDSPEEVHCANRRGSNANWKMLDPQFPKSLWWHTSVPYIGFRVVRPRVTPSEEEIEQYWIEAMEDL